MIASDPFRIVGLSGSLRAASWNTGLLRAAARLAPPGVELRIEDGLGQLPLFDQDIEAHAWQSGPVATWCRRVAGAEALLIATPEYNHSIPAGLKNALDWLSRPGAAGALVGKPVAIIGASSGRWGTRLAQAALRQILFACEARVLGDPSLYLADAAQAFDAQGDLVDPNVAGTLAAIIDAMHHGRNQRCGNAMRSRT